MVPKQGPLIPRISFHRKQTSITSAGSAQRPQVILGVSKFRPWYFPFRQISPCSSLTPPALVRTLTASLSRSKGQNLPFLATCRFLEFGRATRLNKCYVWTSAAKEGGTNRFYYQHDSICRSDVSSKGQPFWSTLHFRLSGGTHGGNSFATKNDLIGRRSCGS